LQNLTDNVDVQDLDTDLFEIDFYFSNETLAGTVADITTQNYTLNYNDNVTMFGTHQNTFKIKIYRKNSFGRGQGTDFITIT